MTATHDTILKADRSGRLRFSPEQRLALLQAYQTSGLSGPRFAALHGVKYQTFLTNPNKSTPCSCSPVFRDSVSLPSRKLDLTTATLTFHGL